MNADKIDLNNLSPELQTMVCTLLAIHHCGNRPADVGNLMYGLYGPTASLTRAEQDSCAQEFAVVLSRLVHLGWITNMDANGCVILTDLGEEKATVLREYYAAAGIIDFSTIPS